MIKVDAIIFLLNSVVLRDHMVENLHIFYSFEILYVTNFTTINEKVTLLCKNIVLLRGKPNFIHLQKFKCYSLLSKFSIKTKKYHKKVKFLKIILENED